MASFFTQLLLLSFAAFLLTSESSLIKVPPGPRAAGVFLLIEGGKYTFNFTAASAACQFLNVTMATTAQMERAVQSGLETCKFGWVAELVAVVPRLTADKNCGQGKTGLVSWFAKTNQKFGVFCFNASDLEENRSSPQGSTGFPTTLTPLTQTSTPGTPPPRAATEAPPSKAPEQTSFTLPIKATHPTTNSLSTTTTLKPFSTHIPTSLSHLITSKPTVVSLAFPTSAHASNISVSSESAKPRTTSSAKPPLGDVPTALIILGVILLLLTAAGVVWYYKLNIFTFWSQAQQKDDTETEMWKHADSEMDLHSQHEGEEEEEEEESDRKYSSDITLCVNPDFKTNSSE